MSGACKAKDHYCYLAYVLLFFYLGKHHSHFFPFFLTAKKKKVLKMNTNSNQRTLKPQYYKEYIITLYYNNIQYNKFQFP